MQIKNRAKYPYSTIDKGKMISGYYLKNYKY